MGLLEGKKVVVLGASSGIGWRIVELFAEQGAQQVIAARRVENLEKLAAQTGAIARRCDATDHDDVQALCQFAIERLGGVDVAINSAGVDKPSAIKDITPELLDEMVAINFKGHYYFMKHFGTAMAAGGGGSIVNITSATAIMVPLNHAPYSGCKAGINFVTKIAAREFGPDNVRVNALAPGFVPTAMNNFGGLTPVDEARVDLDADTPVTEAFMEETPLKKIVTVDDCADVALFLASDLSHSITGQIIPVDNGNHLKRLPDRGRRG